METSIDSKRRLFLNEPRYQRYNIILVKGNIFFLSDNCLEDFIGRVSEGYNGKEYRDIVRFLAGNCYSQNIGRDSRITIPSELLQLAGIPQQKNLRLIGDSEAFYIETTN